MFKGARAALIVSIAFMVVFLTACGESDENESTASAGGTSDGEFAEPKAFLEESLQTPADIGYDEPLPGKPPTGKLIVAMETPVAIAQRVNDYREEAAKALGWRMERIVVGNGPEDPAKAFNQALDMDPDAIFYAGYPAVAFKPELARAKRADITVIAESVTDPIGEITGITRNGATTEHLAKMSAAKVILDTGGKANVQYFGSSAVPILTAFNDSFQKWMKRWCPDCKSTFNDFQYTEIGSTLPSKVVSVLQRSPDTNYLVFGFGDAMVGVEAALRSADLLDQIKIGGGLPGKEQYEALKNGTNAFWAQDTPPWISWREADMMARSFMDASLDVVNDAPLPAQLLTPENIGSTPFDSEGFYLGYDGYEADFRRLWNMQ